MENMLHLDRHNIVECKDPDCPDYGKVIEVFDGIYRNSPFHIERIDGEYYNVQINNQREFGLTRMEVNRLMEGTI